jgi:predicted dehydrogenase
VEPNAERGAAVCQRFAVAAGHFPDVAAMLAAAQPEIVIVATPGCYFKETVAAAMAVL